MDSMYEILRSLPLLQGTSQKKISEIITKNKVHFMKYPPGETILRQDDVCDHLSFVISGSVRVTAVNHDGRFRVHQTFHAPHVLSPQYMFGHHQGYPYSVVAIDDTGILQFTKPDYLRILQSDDVFILNILNTLSNMAQRGPDAMMAITRGSIAERVAYWVLTLTDASATDIVISCKLRDFYGIFGVQRSAFIATLDELHDMNLLDYDQNEVRILDRATIAHLLDYQ